MGTSSGSEKLKAKMFTVDEMKKISDEIKEIWKNDPELLLERENISKILFFGSAISHKSSDGPNIGLFQLIEISWKNFIYPIICIYKAKLNSKDESEDLLKNFILLTNSLSSSFLKSKELLASYKETKISRQINLKLCLVLGDIYKYSLEMSNESFVENAEKFYLEAISIQSKDGIPFNQMGTLFESSYPLKAVLFFYLSSMCQVPFTAADINASTVLNKSREMFFAHIKKKIIIESLSMIIQISFLNMIDVLLFRLDEIDDKRLLRLIASYFEYLNKFIQNKEIELDFVLESCTIILIVLSLLIEKSQIFTSVIKHLKKFLLNNINVILVYVAELFLIKNNEKILKSDENSVDSSDGFVVNDLLNIKYILMTSTLVIKNINFLNSTKQQVAQKIKKVLNLLPTDSLNNCSSQKNSLYDFFSNACFFIIKKNANLTIINDELKNYIDENFESENASLFKSNGASFQPNNDSEFESGMDEEENDLHSVPSTILISHDLAPKISILNGFYIPLSGPFASLSNFFASKIKENENFAIIVLARVLDMLDEQKNLSKNSRLAIDFIDTCFSQNSSFVVPQNQDMSSELAKLKHRNKNILELMHAIKYFEMLIQMSGSLAQNYTDWQKTIILDEKLLNDSAVTDLLARARDMEINIISSKEFDI